MTTIDRRAALDPRNRNYPIRPYVEGTERHSQLWMIPNHLPLNQRDDRGSIAYAWAGALSFEPISLVWDDNAIRDFYRSAQAVDRAAGRNFVEGASLVAGAEVATRSGLITGYRWAFNIHDVIDCLIDKGPIILGLPWFDSMMGVETGGRIRINGTWIGGHAVLATGYVQNHPHWGGNWIQLLNSWGTRYGQRGVGYMREMDLAFLLEQEGEAVTPNEMAPEPDRPWWYSSWRKMTSAFRQD